MFLDAHRTMFTFLCWLDLLGVVLAFWISILKKLQNHFQIADTVIYITKLEKYLESSSGHTLNFFPNLVKFRFKNMFMKEFSPGLLW